LEASAFVGTGCPAGRLPWEHRRGQQSMAGRDEYKVEEIREGMIDA
jgi:hypothetical protein